MFIYIITCQGFCKIGYSGHPEGRTTDAQCLCPPCVTLVLFAKFKVPKHLSPALVEKWCHYELQKYWTENGEWFKVDIKIAVAIIKKVIRRKLTGQPDWFVRSEQSKKFWIKHGPVMAKVVRNRWKDPKYRAMMLKVLRNNRTNRTQQSRNKNSVASLRNWKNPQYRDKVLTARATPECRKRISKAMKLTRSKPAVRKQMSATTKLLWQDPVFRAANIKASKLARSKPEVRKQMSETTKRLWKDPKYIKTQKNALRLVCKTPEFRKRMSETTKRVWKDPSFRERRKKIYKKRADQ